MKTTLGVRQNLTCFALKKCDDVIEDAGDAIEEGRDRLSDEERILREGVKNKK